MVSVETRLALLKKIHLFRALNEDELRFLAEHFSETEYKAGEVIFAQGTKGESFFLIYRGKVRIVRKKEKAARQLAVLVDNDYFGAMELVSNAPRDATATALTDSTILVLSKENFKELLKNNPALKPGLDVSIRSRKLARQLQFRWLHSDEVVYFLARKHPVLLYEAMGPPALVLVAAIALALWSVFTSAITPVAVGAVLFIFDVGWAVWRVIDWSNDYYVVTNERVVWLEKVVGLYDSRQEAPLNTVLSVSVETDVLGRAMDYGNVVVRTFVGKIPFNHVPHPTEAAHAIEEYWQRAKLQTTNVEKEAMKDAIRAKLGMKVNRAAGTKANPANAPKLKTNQIFLRALGADTLKIRYEIGDTVIYRKHWFALVRQAGLPAFLILVLTGLWISHMIRVALDPNTSLYQWVNGSLTIDTLTLTLPILMIPLFVWMVYQVIDWSNDMFQVTQDQIIDLDRTPFGSEERQAAQLENILGTEYRRVGLLGNIFNFGTVYITVGGTQLAFEDVSDPATVQSDIDRRRMLRMAKANESKVAAERDRMAEWLAAYNENADEFQRRSNGGQKTE
ncbi:MAG: cyclic nucleotide-binding domain-containing protein [Bacteroidota bacterium]